MIAAAGHRHRGGHGWIRRQVGKFICFNNSPISILFFCILGFDRFQLHPFPHDYSRYSALPTSSSSSFNQQSLAPLLHDPRPILLVLLLRYPHLMKRPQARQDAAPDPARKLPLVQTSGRADSHSRPARVQRVDLVVQAVREAVRERCAPRHDDVGQQMRFDIDVELRQGGLDDLRDGLAGWRGLIAQRGFDVKQGLHGAEAFEAEDLVIAVGHFEGAAGLMSGDIFVRNAARGVPQKATWRPYLDNGFFEFCEDALFLEASEGFVRGGAVEEGAVGGLGWRASIDGRFGDDFVMRG